VPRRLYQKYLAETLQMTKELSEGRCDIIRINEINQPT
jgi:hypothetical protein